MNPGPHLDRYAWSRESGTGGQISSVDEGRQHTFQILGELGRGGMGVVYRALDVVAQREVALKLALDPEQNPQRLERFRREGQLTAALEHSGIVRIHSTGLVDGRPFLAYELIEGSRTVEDILEEGIAPREAAQLIAGVARALGHAHARGIVHRDVKPENLLVDGSGRARVADFGLAIAADLDRLTRTGAIVGTPHYMAPERFQSSVGEAPAPGVDVWSLGVILYQAICRRTPFEGANLAELAGAVSVGRVVAPRQLDPSLPRDLEAVCLKALCQNPSERYQDGAELAADLERFLSGRRVHARRPRSVLAILAIGAVSVVGLGLLVGGIVSGASDPGPSLAERRAHQGALEDVTQRLTTAKAPLTEDAAAVRRLFTDCAALDGSTDRRAAALRSGAQALTGLLALSEGDLARARESLRRLASAGSSPLASALEGGVAAVDSSADPRAAERALTHAISRGVARPELLGWRALARVRGGGGGQEGAREALSDLASLAKARGGSLLPHERPWRVRALLGARRLDDATAELTALSPPLHGLRWEVAVSRAARAFEADPQAALDELNGLSGRPERGAGEALARRAVEQALALIPRTGVLRKGPAGVIITCCRIARPLSPRGELPLSLVDKLLECADRLDAPTLLILGLAELTPRNAKAQIDLASRMPVVRHPPSKRRLLATVYRAIRLTTSSTKRRELQGLLCHELAELNDGAKTEPRLDEVRDCLATADALLTQDLPPEESARLLMARSRARRLLGDLAGSLRDADAVLALETGQWTVYRFRASTYAALGQRGKAASDAAHFVRNSMDGSYENDRVMAMAWDLSRGTDQDAQILEALKRFLVPRANYGGWWGRAALLELRRGDVQAALQSLERGRAVFEKNRDHLFPAGAERFESTLGALSAGEPALLNLERLVADLDARRAGGSQP